MGLKDFLFGKKKDEKKAVLEPEENEASTVKIYTLPSCGYCKQLRRHLTRHHISFEDINLKEDKGGQKFMKERGYTGVPVTVIDGDEIVGFELDTINERLGIQV
jgi:glutaredoxin